MTAPEVDLALALVLPQNVGSQVGEEVQSCETEPSYDWVA